MHSPSASRLGSGGNQIKTQNAPLSSGLTDVRSLLTWLHFCVARQAGASDKRERGAAKKRVVLNTPFSQEASVLGLPPKLSIHHSHSGCHTIMDFNAIQNHVFGHCKINTFQSHRSNPNSTKWKNTVLQTSVAHLWCSTLVCCERFTAG